MSLSGNDVSILDRDLLDTPDRVLSAQQTDYVKGFASRIADFKIYDALPYGKACCKNQAAHGTG